MQLNKYYTLSDISYGLSISSTFVLDATSIKVLLNGLERAIRTSQDGEHHRSQYLRLQRGQK